MAGPTSHSHSHSHQSHLSLIHLTLLILLLPLSLSTPSPHHQNAQDHEEPDTPVTRFQRYLRINTAHPNPDYSSAVSYLKSQADSLGLRHRTLQFSPNKPLLLLTWPGTDPSLPSILLNSHLDSVPAEPSKWLHPPFSALRTADGAIFARGAQDDKCIAMQYLEAIRNLKERGFAPSRAVHVSLVPDEEIGGFDGAAKFVESGEFEELNVAFALDEGQASTGDEYRVFYADRSPWGLKIKAWGRPGHGSRMYDGSAMENLMRSVEAVSRFRESQFDVVKAGKALNSEVVSVNPVYVKAGVASKSGFVMNVQPSEAEAGFDLRLTPMTDPDEMRRRITAEWAPAARNMSFEIIERGPIRDYVGRPLMTATNDSNPWWLVFKQAITSAGGKLSKPEILASTTDARYLRQKGIPVLGFSPMRNTPILLHDHNEDLFDEWKNEADSEKRKNVLIEFMKKNVNMNKADEAMIITAIVAPPAAMAAKRTGQTLPQLKLMKSVPDVVFVPSATILALVGIKIVRYMFMGKTKSNDGKGPQHDEVQHSETLHNTAQHSNSKYSSLITTIQATHQQHNTSQHNTHTHTHTQRKTNNSSKYSKTNNRT